MKQLIISKNQHNQAKEVINNMTCLKDGEIKIARLFNVNNNIAFKILTAVYYNYKCLLVK